jgi:dihydroxy-acid dehydratase
VFEDEEGALEALRLGQIRQVIVLRGLGPRGGPGTVFVSSFIAAVGGVGLADHLAIITDGQVSGLNRGLSIGQVMPEAAEGGPLASVCDGGPIVIDLEDRKVDLAVEEGILRERAARWTPPVRRLKRG